MAKRNKKTLSYMGDSSITAFSLYLSTIIGGGGGNPAPSLATTLVNWKSLTLVMFKICVVPKKTEVKNKLVFLINNMIYPKYNPFLDDHISFELIFYAIDSLH